MEFVKHLELDYFVISETKVYESFPSQEIVINNFKSKAREDRDCHGGGMIEFVRKGFICRRLKHLDPNNLECICSEVTISNKNGSPSVSIDHPFLKI